MLSNASLRTLDCFANARNDGILVGLHQINLLMLLPCLEQGDKLYLLIIKN